MNDEADRGTGRTANQMLAAPQKAVFVWVSLGSIDYARDLAHHIGRDDLEIIAPEQVGYLRGRDLSGIVFDHAIPQ